MAQLKDMSKLIEKAVRETVAEISKPSTMQQVGNKLKDDIVRRTRLGYGVEKNGGEKFKFKKLSDSYVQQRQRKLGFWTNGSGKVVPIETKNVSRATKRNNQKYLNDNLPKLDGTTSPKKSNVTRTGTMLSLIGVVSGYGKFLIGFKTSKQGQKASFVSKERPFMNASRLEIKRVTTDISKRLNAIIKKKFNF